MHGIIINNKYLNLNKEGVFLKKLISILLLSSFCISLFGFSIANANIYRGINNERLKIKSTNLDNTCLDWSVVPNDKFITPKIDNELNFKLSDYHTIYNGPKSQKTKSLYLTFNEDYENGYTNQILDVLKEKNVKAIFFVTSYYVVYSPDTVERMVNEGHIVANHSKHHYSMPSITYSTDIFNNEISDVEYRFKELTGKNMCKFFRPPMGKYSQKSLAMAKNLGYETVFWSFSYCDSKPTNQPSTKYAKKYILGHLHDGSIILLQALSRTNAKVLGDVIDAARKEGYEFYLLPEKESN